MNISDWDRFCAKHGYRVVDGEHIEGKQLYVAERPCNANKHMETTYWDMRWGIGLGEKMDLVRNINIPAYHPSGVLVTPENRKRIVLKDVRKHVEQMKRVGRWH
jgi:hypothetical protein